MGNDVTDAGDKFRKLSQQLVAVGDEVISDLELVLGSLRKTCQERDEWRRRWEQRSDASDAVCEDLEHLRQQLAASRQEWAGEREQRLRWQDAAYAAFRLIDAINGNTINRDHVTIDTCDSQVSKARVKLRTLLSRRAALEDSFALIEQLTEEEGSTVTLLGANPEFGGPDYAVFCSGSWTGWADERYEGQTLNDALRAALEAKRARLPENYPPIVLRTPSSPPADAMFSDQEPEQAF